jgi:hypothetical protein
MSGSCSSLESLAAEPRLGRASKLQSEHGTPANANASLDLVGGMFRLYEGPK